MKTRISLLVAYLAFVGFAKPINAEITNSASPPPTSTRVKDLETILRKSGLCSHYPNIVKILKDNTAEIATYADRRLSDDDIKLLAINLAKLVFTNVNKLTQVKVRFYDPASTKYWKDIVLKAEQIQNDLKSGPAQDEVLNSIKLVNNPGLVDGPNLETRIDLYRHIYKLQRAGISVKSYISKFKQIEKAEENKQKIDTLVSELNNSLVEADKPITSPNLNDTKSGALVNFLEEAWQDAKSDEKKALQAVEDAEQEQQTTKIPDAYDLDSQARYESLSAAIQKKIDAALATWHQAIHDRDAAYAAYMQAKGKSL